MYSRKKLLSLLNGLLDNFTEKIFISKNDKVEAVILPLEEYEILKENYEEYTNKKFLSYNFVEIKKGK
jgi:PHD/YefM family antitoxin component YafN of YafNO toxin-antitoxin module